MKAGTLPYFSNVLKELINIKKHATKEEINRLNIFELNPNDQEHCIYGQMTGNCFGYRAEELIGLCCITNTSFVNISTTVTESQNRKPRNIRFYCFTYLEHCINNYKHNNENIIKFLKSEINEIKLTSKP